MLSTTTHRPGLQFTRPALRRIGRAALAMAPLLSPRVCGYTDFQTPAYHVKAAWSELLRPHQPTSYRVPNTLAPGSAHTHSATGTHRAVAPPSPPGAPPRAPEPPNPVDTAYGQSLHDGSG